MCLARSASRAALPRSDRHFSVLQIYMNLVFLCHHICKKKSKAARCAGRAGAARKALRARRCASGVRDQLMLCQVLPDGFNP
jgi:hypothetical protein